MEKVIFVTCDHCESTVITNPEITSFKDAKVAMRRVGWQVWSTGTFCPTCVEWGRRTHTWLGTSFTRKAIWYESARLEDAQ